MVKEQYELLKTNVLKLMIDELTKKMESERSAAEATETEPAAAASGAANANTLKGVKRSMFAGFAGNKRKPIASDSGMARRIRQKCEAELAAYLMDPGLPVIGDDGSHFDPLKWWASNHHRFEVLAMLALKYLSIPGTSAPSERVWSRAAQVLTAKRSKLDPEVSSGIMFVKENMPMLAKHWAEVTKDAKDALPLEMAGIPAMLGTAAGKEIDVDVGLDVIGKEF